MLVTLNVAVGGRTLGDVEDLIQKVLWDGLVNKCADRAAGQNAFFEAHLRGLGSALIHFILSSSRFVLLLPRPDGSPDQKRA